MNLAETSTVNMQICLVRWAIQDHHGPLVCLIFAQKHRLWYPLEPPRRVATIYALSRNMKTSEFFIWKFSVFGGNIFYIFDYARFRYDFQVDNSIVFGTSWTVPSYAEEHAECLINCTDKNDTYECPREKLQTAQITCERIYYSSDAFKVCNFVNSLLTV